MQVQEDILADIQETIWYQDASATTRFLNFVVDLIFVIILIVAVRLFLFPELSDSYIGKRVLTYTLMLSYYSLLETATNGRTIGKFVTGTKTIREDGNEFSGSDAVLRSLCRLVPFEALSAFGVRPWHDKWTKTRVVKTR